MNAPDGTLAQAAVTAVSAVLLVASAVSKLSGRPEVVASYARVGVPRRLLPVLAVLLLAGAGGLVAGLWWRALGVAAAACLTAYFLVALGAHARHRDLGRAGPPSLLLFLVVTSLALHLS